jgi:hypothetical protein
MKNFYKKPSNYSTIPNSFSQNSSLTIEARGLGLLILSLPDTWVFRQTWFYGEAGPSKNRAKTVVPALNELKEKGYLASIQIRSDGGKFDEAKWMFDPDGDAYQCLVKVLKNEGYVVDQTENTMSVFGTENTSSDDATSDDARSRPIKEVVKKYISRKKISSSSQHLAIEEEEDFTVDKIISFEMLPEEIDGLSREVVIDGIVQLASKNAGDFEIYCKTLVRDVLSGSGRTVANIQKIIQKQYGQLPVGVNIFDIIGRET